MLVTRICAPEYSPWQSHEYKSSPLRLDSPRMSDKYDLPPPHQPDWQGQYSYLPQTGGDNKLHKPYADAMRGYDEPRPSFSMAEDLQAPPSACVKKEECSLIRPRSSSDSVYALGNASRSSTGRQHLTPSDKVGSLDDVGSYGRHVCFSRTSRPKHLRTVLSIDTESASEPSNLGHEEDGPEFTGGEEGEIEEGDGDTRSRREDMTSRPQTMEERLAARRKMKRFRLTHQQTRFLMSEFAKQPHPDAAHRERLSREIPGLSPRQVQVWFQNRRAKIKRLTADDRDRVVRMRAVPDGFDNIQALHSPYGAVHGLTIPTSPGDAPNATYGGQMLRPLMVDVRRQEESYVTSTALTPPFGALDLTQAGGMSGSDILSPLSSVSSSKFGPESHLITSRTPSASIRHQSNLDSAGQVGKSILRHGQSMHVREPLGRSAPDSLQSPMRGGISWKPDPFDYISYHEASAVSSATDRHPTTYQTNRIGSASADGLEGFEPPYSGSFPSLPESHVRQRVRASSASFPLAIDLRAKNIFRPVGASGAHPSACNYEHGAATATKADDTSIYSTLHSPTASSAPKSLAGSRLFDGRATAFEGQVSQLSSHVTAPHDFGRALHAALGGKSSHGAMKEYFESSSM